MKKQNWAPDAIQLPAGTKHALVALSGGADSVYLLLALLSGGGKVSAAHFHHGMRGDSADGDMRFCRELCAELDVPLYEGGADVPAYAEMNNMGVETAARELRYRFLRNIRRAIGADVIALGHHMNDQAETVMRAMRKTIIRAMRCAISFCRRSRRYIPARSRRFPVSPRSPATTARCWSK